MSTLHNFKSINWAQCAKELTQLQQNITVAYENGNLVEVTKWQEMLVRSFAARALAVRKVMTNPGGKTPGIDNVVWDDKTGYEAIKELRDLGSYKASPVRRVFIPKANGKMRPLGIPTMKDRAVQALYAMALTPIAECHADPNSYGYRAYRSVHDVATFIWLTCGGNYGKRWVLEGDIKGFFDNISHEWVLKNIPMNKRILKEFLKAGFMHADTLYTTDEGTPQGGIISPVIANMVLDGLEFIVKGGVKVCRYADDFVVMGKTKERLERTLPMIRRFLADRGLELNMDKTQIVSIEEGFDFVGFNFREYPEEFRKGAFQKSAFLIKPKKASILALRRKLRKIINDHKQKPVHMLIVKLNQVLRGWAEHYRTVSSKRIFAEIGRDLWGLLWKMLRNRYRGIPLRVLRDKFFKTVGGNNWVFFSKDPSTNVTVTLFQIAWVEIKRHALVPNLNPYKPDNEHVFSSRSISGVKQSVTANRNQRKLAELQNNICPVCKQALFNGETLEVHHRLSRKEGGADKLANLVLLHNLCHKQVTHSKDPKLTASWLKDGIIITK